jgi:hypothetical protein
MTAVPVPRTWVDGDLITAEMLNTELRDTLRYITNSNQTMVKLATTQSISNATTTAINWDTEIEDTDGLISVPDTDFTFTRSGVMAVRLHIGFPSGTGGNGRQCNAIYTQSGQAAVNYGGVSDGGCSESDNENFSFSLPVGIGDKLKFNIYQDNGGSLSIAADCTIRWVGAVPDWIDYDNPAPPPAPGGSGGGDSGGGTPPPKKKYNKTYRSTWSATYTGGGSSTSLPDCYQGENGPGGGMGNERSLIGFDYSSIKSDLSGATNISMTLHCHYQWSYFSGFWVQVGGHSYSSKPGSWSTSNVDEQKFQKNMGPGWHDYDLTSYFTKGFQSGAVKGIAIGPGLSSNGKYNGAVSGADINRASLIVSYYK